MCIYGTKVKNTQICEHLHFYNTLFCIRKIHFDFFKEHILHSIFQISLTAVLSWSPCRKKSTIELTSEILTKQQKDAIYKMTRVHIAITELRLLLWTIVCEIDAQLFGEHCNRNKIKYISIKDPSLLHSVWRSPKSLVSNRFINIKYQQHFGLGPLSSCDASRSSKNKKGKRAWTCGAMRSMDKNAELDTRTGARQIADYIGVHAMVLKTPVFKAITFSQDCSKNVIHANHALRANWNIIILIQNLLFFILFFTFWARRWCNWAIRDILLIYFCLMKVRYSE